MTEETTNDSTLTEKAAIGGLKYVFETIVDSIVSNIVMWAVIITLAAGGSWYAYSVFIAPFKAVQEAVVEGVGAVTDTATAAKDSVVDSTTGTATTVKETGQAVVKKADDASTAVIDTVKDTSTAAKDGVAKIVDSVTESSSDTKDKVVEGSKNLWQKATGLLDAKELPKDNPETVENTEDKN